MKKIVTIISFIISGIFVITGLALFPKSPLSGIFSILLAIVIFPRTKAFVLKKFKYDVSWKIKTGVIVALLIAMLSTAPKSDIVPSVVNQQSELPQTTEQTVAASSPEVAEQTQSDPVLAAQIADTENKTPAPQVQASDLVKVVSVTDGDTIKVSINGTTQTVRMIGMDTPETVDPRKPVQCFGKEASNKTKSTLLNQMVRLESDPTQGDLDKYQRLLRYVFLADGSNFEKMMIEQGYAHEYTYDTPYKYQAEFKAAQKDAQANQRGLWSPTTCNGTTESTSETTVQPTPTPTPQPTQQSGHTFYLSSYKTAKYYYCDTDDGWKGLDVAERCPSGPYSIS
jgi:micrococcal nuclease